MNNMRASFEKWASNQWFYPGSSTTFHSVCQEYDDRECQAAWEAYQEAYNLQQATIDLLMLEFCPQEMSREQFKNWENAQKRALEGYKNV